MLRSVSGVGYLCAPCCSGFVYCEGNLSERVRYIVGGFYVGYVIEFNSRICDMAVKAECW